MDCSEKGDIFPGEASKVFSVRDVLEQKAVNLKAKAPKSMGQWGGGHGQGKAEDAPTKDFPQLNKRVTKSKIWPWRCPEIPVLVKRCSLPN